MKLMLLICATLFSLLFTHIPLSKDTADIKDFYFPYEGLTTPKVYQYTNSDNLGENRYLYLHAFKKNNDFYLTSTTYDIYFRKGEEVTKKITDTGPIIVEYIVYPTDLKGKTMRVPCYIETSEVLHWKCFPGDRVRWKVSYPIPENPNCQQVLFKNREFLNQKEYRDFKGKSYPVCRFFDTFQVKEVCTSISYGWAPSTYYRQNYYYAERLGLIEYHYSIPNGHTKIFKLTDIMTKGEWKALVAQK